MEVAVDSVAARGAVSGGAASEGAVSGGAEPGGAEPGGTELEGAEPGGVESEGAESEGAELRGTASGAAGVGGSAAGGTGAGGAGATSLGDAGVHARARGTGGARAGGPGGARTRGTGAAGVCGVGGAEGGGAGAGDAGARARGTGAEGAEAEGTGAGGAGAGGAGAGDPGTGGAGARGAGAVDPGAGDLGAGGAGVGGAASGGTSAGGTTDSFTELREPESRPASPVRAVCIGHRVPRPLPPPVPCTHIMALRPSSFPLRVPLSPPPVSSLPAVPDLDSDLACAACPTVPHLLATVVTDPSFESTAASTLVVELVEFAAAYRLDYATSLEDFECLAATVPHLVAMLLAPEGDPDAPDIPTPRSYAEAIMGPYSSQWQTAMDAEMASWMSTGTYVEAVPPSKANIVDGMWIFMVKRPSVSPPVFKARYVARGFRQRQGVDFFQTFSPTPKMTTLRVLLHVAAQRDYELHSLDFSTAFLQGTLHEEIWLRRPPGFTGLFPADTQWSIRRPVYGLRQAPREWHDTLGTTLAALGFAPSTADPSLFLCTDTSLPLFYVLVYVDDLVFATADTEALTLVKSELQKRHTRTDLGELRSYLRLQITRDIARRTITLTQSHMVHQVLQRFGFRYSSP
ncbi:unnamed protein product [Closterium sp. NIES-54]